MSRLLILYLLLEGPRSGYDLKRILTRAPIRFWFRIEDASIYSTLKTLARHGFSKAHRSDRAVRHEVTRAGVEQFDKLADRAWESTSGRDFEAALAVSDGLSRPALRRRLARRLTLTRTRAAELQAVRPGALSALLARREDCLLRAELDWLNEELRRIDHES